MLNNAEIIGNVGKDPELKYSSSGVGYVRISIAVKDDFKQQDGSHKTTWINCVAFNKLAEIIAQYCEKGRQVYISGKLVSNQYKTASGDNATSYEIQISKFYLLSSKNSDQSNSNSGSNNYTRRSENDGITKNMGSSDPFSGDDSQVNISDDDLPF